MEQAPKKRTPEQRAMTTRIANALYQRHLKGEKVGTFRKWADLDKLIEEDNRLIAERDEKNRPHLVAVKDSKP